MPDVVYLSSGDVRGLHARVLRAMGQAPCALLRPDTLDSAVHAPRQAAHYEGADLIRKAAILAIRIAQAQRSMSTIARNWVFREVGAARHGLRPISADPAARPTS